MKVYVLDTAVLVAGFRSDKGASRRLLELARDRRFRLLLSVPLILEYEAILTRPEQRAVSRLSEEQIAEALNALAILGERVHLELRLRPQLLDDADEMVLETAFNGHADAIVTFNERDFRIASERFGFSVIRPARALREIEGDSEWHERGR